MGQRVNIQYSVDIGELDAEVQRLVERSRSRLSALVDSFPSGASVLSLETAEAIDTFRAELAEIDYCLDDVNKIITGYVSYQSKTIGAETSQAQPPPEQHDEDLMAHMEEQLRQLDASPASVEEVIEEFKKSSAQP